MTPLAMGLVLVAGVGAAVDWAAVWSGGRNGLAIERVAKPLVLLALLGLAILLPRGAHPEVRPWLLAALAASLVGDVLLLPPGRFVGGLVAFLVGHVAYLAAFVQLPGSDWGAAAGATVAFAMIAFVGHDIVAAARPAALRVPVGVYLVVICGMATAATWTLLPAAIAGAWLFVASDSILGWDRFSARPAATKREARLRRLAVMVTYHLGQMLLVVALTA